MGRRMLREEKKSTSWINGGHVKAEIVDVFPGRRKENEKVSE